VRGFAIGIVVGTLAVLVAALEIVRRNAERDRVRAALWPRPDGSARSYGEVWDHPTPSDPVLAA
jgi:hypothetical protein